RIIEYKRRTAEKYGPFGEEWVHDKNTDDIMNEKHNENLQKYEKLRAIISPDQCTPGWYQLRDTKITASDGAVALGLNKYEPQYSFILKKTIRPPFKSNIHCYHGKKYEDIATMIYEYRMNVHMEAFGLL